MKAQFEEKQYESHLNRQLATDNRLLYPPGQFLENTLGFDAAFGIVSSHPFWRLTGHHRTHPSGTRLKAEWWEALDESLPYFPRFTFNLFLQYKRPERMHLSSASEWDDWGQKYYRYQIEEDQQEALEELRAKIRGQGDIYYACPAFHKLAELWEAVENQRVVERSNFAQLHQTHDHSVYSYVQPGGVGKGHSKTEPVESVPLSARIDQLSEGTPADSNRQFLVRLGRQVQSVASDTSSIAGLHSEITQALTPEGNENELASALAAIDAFRYITRTGWLIGFAAREVAV